MVWLMKIPFFNIRRLKENWLLNLHMWQITHFTTSSVIVFTHMLLATSLWMWLTYNFQKSCFYCEYIKVKWLKEKVIRNKDDKFISRNSTPTNMSLILHDWENLFIRKLLLFTRVLQTKKQCILKLKTSFHPVIIMVNESFFIGIDFNPRS